MHRLNLNGYEPDRHHEAAVAFCIHAGTDELTSPVHQHRKGQLILALHGAITCTVENALWMVAAAICGLDTGEGWNIAIK
ncbi:AraC family transcriptional regulator [Escherichia coli]|uniref:AraC family transcriptional regulator n=1 Tax=Escherichia coli TaxID=562 RepID=A0A377A446_ECOLX|nr:AraC family transcriptional regulator [Escherichia coli]